MNMNQQQQQLEQQKQQESNLSYTLTSTTPLTENSSNSPFVLKRQDQAQNSNLVSKQSSIGTTILRPASGNGNEVMDEEDDKPNNELELDDFIMNLLSKPSERMFLLKLEQDLSQFIRNFQMYRLDLPQMNSYQRLMVHKVAPYFHLSHFFDPLHQSIFLCKNPLTKVPSVSFMELVSSPEGLEQQSTFKIMKRAPLSSHHNHRRHHRSNNNNQGLSIEERKKGMTFEERKTAYEEARARIFSDLEETQPQP